MIKKILFGTDIMRMNSLLTLMLFCFFSFLLACETSVDLQRSDANNQPAQNATPSDGVRRVSIAELQSLLEKNEAVVVDVRDEVQYKLGHIRGARSIPLGLVGARAGELPRDKLIVAYCA